MPLPRTLTILTTAGSGIEDAVVTHVFYRYAERLGIVTTPLQMPKASLASLATVSPLSSAASF